MGYTSIGIIILPILPIPEQNAKPLDLSDVEYDSVVNGYSIWLTDFMASLDKDMINTLSI